MVDSYPNNEVIYKWKEENISIGWFPIQIDDGVKLSQFDLLGTNWNDSQAIQKGSNKLFFSQNE